MPQKTHAKITALYNTNPRSVQLVARNRKSRTEVEFPRSVQLVARNRQSHTEVESFVHQDARYTRNRE